MKILIRGLVCQAEEAIVVESAKMQFAGRPATSTQDDQQQQQQQQQQHAVASNDARHVDSQQSRRANRCVAFFQSPIVKVTLLAIFAVYLILITYVAILFLFWAALPPSCNGSHFSFYLLPMRITTDLLLLNFMSNSSANLSHTCNISCIECIECDINNISSA